jgi:hypothetical protein
VSTLHKPTAEEVNRAVALVLGWQRRPDLDWLTDVEPLNDVVRHEAWVKDNVIREAMHLDFSGSLDACAEMEASLDALPMDQRSLWLDYLGVIVNWRPTKNAADLRFEVAYAIARATAPQRTEAFLRVHGRWEGLCK